MAAETLTELIKDNDDMVDQLESTGMVEKFLSLIRSRREAQYLKSLA